MRCPPLLDQEAEEADISFLGDLSGQKRALLGEASHETGMDGLQQVGVRVDRRQLIFLSQKALFGGTFQHLPGIQ